jgi:predicted kinase
MSKKALILMGLPASGKTTFAKEYDKIKEVRDSWRGYRSIVKHIDIDSLKTLHGRKNRDLENIIGDSIWNTSKNEFIIDGLFLTNENIIKIINICKNYNIDSFEIHYWNPDIEKCLRNDKYRRDEESSITIKNAVLEKLDIEQIKSETQTTNINIVYHDIESKPEYKIFADKYNITLSDDLYVKSDSWSLGGSYQNCWGTGGSVSADEQPESFEQFDSLLEEVCANITFLQYKKLNNECVDIDTYNDRDYYGGSIEYAYFRCNVEKLVNLLHEMNLLDINDL